MSLFDELRRVETRPKRQNEASFDYLNGSARPGIAAIRLLFEDWFERLPDSGKADLRARFRKGEEVSHHGAFFELFCNELLRRSGYEVEVHPTLPNRKTPDFLVSRACVPQFYFEATLAANSEADQAAERRIAELHDTLDRMDSPDYFLDMEYEGTPEDNVDGRALRGALGRWLGTLDFNDVVRLSQDGRYQELPRLDWALGEFSLTFRPIPKSPELRGQPGARPVGVVMPGAMRALNTHDAIRTAIERKAAKYRNLDCPLLVAVNVMDDFCDDDDIYDALFGEQQVVARRQRDGGWTHEQARIPNGAWHGRRGARNVGVSAAIIVHQLVPTTLRVAQVEVIHNPWSAHPLAADLLPLVQRSVRLPGGQIDRRPGTSAADVLGIPKPWPIPD